MTAVTHWRTYRWPGYARHTLSSSPRPTVEVGIGLPWRLGTGAQLAHSLSSCWLTPQLQSVPPPTAPCLTASPNPPPPVLSALASVLAQLAKLAAPQRWSSPIPSPQLSARAILPLAFAQLATPSAAAWSAC